MDSLKQRAFAAAFGSWDHNASLRRYYDLFEAAKQEEEEDFDVEEFEPEDERDVQEMLNAARRAGVLE